MYLTSPTLNVLVTQALGMYQDKAGPVKMVAFDADADSVSIPEDFLGVAVVLDSEGRWHEANIDAENLVIVAQRHKSRKPYKIWYFVNMRGMAIGSGVLPLESVSILFDYLHALIDIPNTQRAKEVAAATGLQLDLPDPETLKQRKDLLEQAMEDCQSIIPMATVY